MLELWKVQIYRALVNLKTTPALGQWDGMDCRGADVHTLGAVQAS